MILTPTPLGRTILDAGTLKTDRKQCLIAGPCGMGEKALYLNSFYISRRYYVVYSDIRRVFKRVAMSEGGFTGKGLFGSIPYLVVVLKDGREKQCNFKVEDNVDAVLKWLGENHPEIPLVTEKAEAAANSADRHKTVVRDDDVPGEVQREIDALSGDAAFLQRKPEIYQNLAAAVRRKRTLDQMPRSSVLLAAGIAIAGIAGIFAGLCSFFNGSTYAMYPLLFGFAFLFFALSGGTLPIGSNTPAAARRRWESALSRSAEYISGKPGFFLPPQYAHPVVCERMIRVLESGRASTRSEALRVVKDDLKKLRSDVKVSQSEYDEVVQVKSLFLECDYKDELQ